MLKATTQPLTTRFYGKTNWGEFAWFVIFMGCLGLGALFIIVKIILSNLYFLKSPLHLLSALSLILYTSIILYWGFLMRWEYKDGGKNAVEDFWKKFWRGKVPRLVDIRVEQPGLEDYVKRLGKYPEDLTSEELADMFLKLKKEFGDEEYVVFDFYRGIMHVYVYIPVRVFMKLEKILDGRRYDVIKRGDKKVLKYEDGEEIELSDEEYETLRFLDVLVRTQPENIMYIKDLKDRLKSGRIDLREYILEAYRFKF